MRRRKLRILLALFVLLLTAAGAVQILLRTDLPRQWVMDAVSRELGVEVTAGSLRTNLWRQTTLTDLALKLPMEEDPFVAVSHVGISHRPLPLVLLGGSLACRSVRIVNPSLTLQQDEAGRWNVQQFASSLSRVTAGPEKKTRASLPELDVVNASSTIVTHAGHVEHIGPVAFYGAPRGPARWDFEMSIPSQAAISGTFSAGPDWAHEIRFDFSDLNDLAGRWIPDSSGPLLAAGTLYGHLAHGELTGKLQLDHLQCGRTEARGTLGINASAAKFLVRLEEFWVRDARLALEEFKITGGSVHLDAQHVRADHVLVEAGGVSTSLTGHWDRAAAEATLSGSWEGEGPKPRFHHAGTWTGSVSWPRIGTRRAALSLTGRARSPAHHWQGQIDMQGSGRSWLNSQWQILVPRLESEWKDTHVVMEDIRAEIDANWPDVRLMNLSTANAEHVNAQGEFSARQRDWTLSIEAAGLRAAREQGRPIDLSLVLNGGSQSLSVEQFRVGAPDGTIELAGKIALPSTELSEAHAKASWLVSPAGAATDTGGISGELRCDAAIAGMLRPTNMDIQMQISGQNVAFNRKALGRLTIPCHAQLKASQVKYETGQFQLFGGAWGLRGEHDFSRQSLQVALDANQVMLQPVAELFELPLTCQGLIDAGLEVVVPLSDVHGMTASGSWEIRDMNLPPIKADSAEGRIRIRDGAAAFDQIRLKRDQGLALAGAEFRLDQPQRVSVEVEVQQWPTTLPNRAISFVTDGSAELVLDLAKRSAVGNGILSTRMAIDQSEFGNISAQIAAEQRTVSLRDIEIDLLGGTAVGTAQIPLDDWLGSRMEIQWRDVETAAMADWWPQLAGLTGRSSGSLTAAPTNGPRALGRLGVDIRASTDGGDFRGAQIGGCRMSAYLGQERLLIDESHFDLMGGTVSVFASMRPKAGKGSAYLRADFSHIDANQLVHVFLPSAKPVEGRLSGKWMLVGLSDLRGLTGRADIELAESDLAHTAVVSTLYDALNLKFADSAPSGRGQVSLRFEGSSLKISSFAYFNRGAEIRGAATIEDLTQAKASSISGYAIGSLRPLRDIRLPGVRDLDRLMASLQTGVSSVKLGGTLAEPEVTLVPFRDVDQALRALLWRQLGQ